MQNISLTMLAVCSLATYRIVRLIAVEEGPFSLSLKLRGVLDPDRRTWIGRGMACPWCLSFWIGPVTLYAARYEIGAILIAGLAVSALVGLAVQCGGMIMDYANQLLRRR